MYSRARTWSKTPPQDRLRSPSPSNILVLLVGLSITNHGLGGCTVSGFEGIKGSACRLEGSEFKAC